MAGLLDIARKHISAVLIAASLTACGAGDGSRGSDAGTADAEKNPTAPLANPLDAQTTAKLFAPLRSLSVEQLDQEALWALSSRDDAYGFTDAYLRSLAPRRGVLPQLLVPEIKREIKNNSTFKALRAFAKSTLQPIVDVIFKLMINDETLADQIRQSIVAKLQKAFPTGTRKLASQPLRFDFFPYQSGSAGLALADATTSGFAALDQAVRAAYVFNVPDLWNGKTDDTDGNSGLQLLQIARIMSEWRYAFGLGEQEGGLPTGGLLFDAAQPNAASLSRIDPNAATASSLLFTGQYSVRFEDTGPLGLDLDVREVWQRAQGNVDLVEQAMIGETAARAFMRLRPTARGKVQSLFDSTNGLLPDNAHELPLALLPGLQKILSSGVIDEDRRLVRKTALLPGVASADPDAPADLKGLVRTLRALGSWKKQLASLSPGEVQVAADGQLTEIEASLERAMQLISYLTLRDHVHETADGRATFVNDVDGKEANPALYAEALATLLEANSGSFASEFLATRVDSLFRYYASEIVARGPITDAQTTLWTMKIFELLENDAAARARFPWLTDAKTTLQAAFRAWNDAIRSGGTP